MFLAAAFVPDTALLVPGASGRTEVLVELRAHALAAVRAVLARGPERLVVVAPGASDRVVDGPVRAGLGAAGVPRAALGWRDGAAGVPSSDAASQVPVIGVAASVALLLVRHAGWDGALTVVETGPGQPAESARARGAWLAAEHASTGFVVAGSLSARHGPDAPLADDDRARPFDAAALEWLAQGDPDARDRLAALDRELATELAVSAWAPWQVLLSAVEPTTGRASAVRTSLDAHVLAAESPFGAQYLVATWIAQAAVPA